MPTTRPLPPDLLLAFPELEPKTTVRLHPRRGVLPAAYSKFGGQIMWPEGGDWPECEEHQATMAPVLQLLARDVPEVRFPDGVDVLQILWCPIAHNDTCGPRPSVFWRTSAELVGTAMGRPGPAGEDEYWVVRPCHVCPERVVELPHVNTMAEGRVAEIDEWILGRLNDWWVAGLVEEPTDKLVERYERRAPHLYSSQFSVAPGSKVGGYPDSLGDDVLTHRCGAGHDMEYLLTVANVEHEYGEWRRWLPVEHRVAVGQDRYVREALALPLGLDDTRMDHFHFFVCRRCEVPEVGFEFDSM